MQSPSVELQDAITHASANSANGTGTTVKTVTTSDPLA
jgi:hypothetical protein